MPTVRSPFRSRRPLLAAAAAIIAIATAGSPAPARAESAAGAVVPPKQTVLFIGNSFTFGANSPVWRYRADTVTDLNGEGVGGVPALFKLLAFVDPGTPSGASFRQGMAVQGGIQGLLSGSGGSGGGSSAASSADSSGRSAGEQNAEGSTGDRFSQSAQGFLGSLGAGGQAMAKGMGMISSAGAKATSLMADETNQAMIAAAAMSLSSVSVISNALRLKSIKL